MIVDQIEMSYLVSIHASAREATIYGTSADGEMVVSIHASAREATVGRWQLMRDVVVSIHASAREATSASRRRMLQGSCFNPRLREGGDQEVVGYKKSKIEFQSTPPRGRRRDLCVRK